MGKVATRLEAVRIGIIGAGSFARSRLLPNFRAIPGVELVARVPASEGFLRWGR